MYTDETNSLILISLLKQHGIKRIVVSPGSTNASFVASLQSDPFFELISCVDERSAAFIACGISKKSKEPVALSCTGATASRNYLPALTYAFENHIPILAITSCQHISKIGNLNPQVIDRTKQYSNCYIHYFQSNTVYSYEDKELCITKTNEALLKLFIDNPGPVHIDLVTTYSNKYLDKLPTFRKITLVDKAHNCPSIEKYNRIGIFIGSHEPFSKEEVVFIEKFCESNNAFVICDHTSNYYGKYKVFPSIITNQNKYSNQLSFDLLIHIGGISGAYFRFAVSEVWRIDSLGFISDTFLKLTHVFKMDIGSFFINYLNDSRQITNYESIKKLEVSLRANIPNLPFSNLWMAQALYLHIPKKSYVFFGILNSLRSWNYFELNEVTCRSNVGGFGIDGCFSSLIGSALTNPTVPHFGIFGDLSFFYDLNCLWNFIPPNVHIIVVNNGTGVEFKNYSNLHCSSLGEKVNKYIAATGHNGNKSRLLLKSVCQELKINYLFVNNKDKFSLCLDTFINNKGPLLLEAFIDEKNDNIALKQINSILQYSTFRDKIKHLKILNPIKKVLRK